MPRNRWEFNAPFHSSSQLVATFSSDLTCGAQPGAGEYTCSSTWRHHSLCRWSLLFSRYLIRLTIYTISTYIMFQNDTGYKMRIETNRDYFRRRGYNNKKYSANASSIPKIKRWVSSLLWKEGITSGTSPRKTDEDGTYMYISIRSQHKNQHHFPFLPAPIAPLVVHMLQL